MASGPQSSQADVIAAEIGNRPSIEVWGRHAMVSSMSPLATEAGIAVLRDGGNAVDAAIAVASVVSVTNHNWSGIAGDSAWLIYTACDGRSYHLDGYSVCPDAMTVAELSQRTGVELSDALANYEEPPEQRDRGVATSMVPGTPAAWNAALKRFGTRSMAELIKTSVDLAREGIPLSSYVRQSLQSHQTKLGSFSSSKGVYFATNGSVLDGGQTVVQADLAATLERYGNNPEKEFVIGETAQNIAAYCKDNGGFITLQDLKNYKAKWRDPVFGSYRGHRICVTAPPTAGIHLIQALAMIERFDLVSMPFHSAESLHILIEAVKLSLADRRKWGGDPDRISIPVHRLLNEDYLEELGTRIHPGKSLVASMGGNPGAYGTTHFVIIDQEGNIVSATQSIGGDFGCGETISGTGLIMNDRSWWMSLHEGPNQVCPGHRVNIGHAPVIVFKEQVPWMSVGSPGGFGILSYVTQTLVNVIDYGLPLQLAIECPRFRVNNLAHKVGYEERIDAGTIAELKSYGHDLEPYPPWSDKVGGLQGFTRDLDSGALAGGYDPRRNCAAIGF